MLTLSKTSDYGTIEYRLPRPSEVFKLTRIAGITSEDLSTADLRDVSLLALEKIYEKMDDFIVKVECIIDDEIVDTFEKAKEKMELFQMISSIAQELFMEMNPEAKKKTKQSTT